MSDAKKSLRKGQKVSWGSSHGEVQGTVERVITKPATVKGHRAAASPEHPEVVVKSDRTGAEAIHRPDALHERSR